MRRLDHCPVHDGPEPPLRHLPGDYSLATFAGCGRLFSSFEILDTPCQQAQGRDLYAFDLTMRDLIRSWN
jgi:hypothetical protein